MAHSVSDRRPVRLAGRLYAPLAAGDASLHRNAAAQVARIRSAVESGAARSRRARADFDDPHVDADRGDRRRDPDDADTAAKAFSYRFRDDARGELGRDLVS